MSSRFLPLAAVLVLVLGGSAAGAPGPKPPARSLGATAPATEVRFALNLKLDDRLLGRDLAAGMPVARSAAALGRRYGLPLTDERRVVRTLATHGISVVSTYPQRTEVDAQASVAVLERFFDIRFRDYTDQYGGRYHAPSSAPTLPASLRPFVSGVVGLSSRPLALPAALPHGALRPADAALAYDVAPLQQQGIDGRGQRIAIASLEPFPPDQPATSHDVSTFRSTFHADGPQPTDVKVDGGGQGSDLAEDELDLEVMSAIAPAAQIVNYEAPKTASGEVDVFAKIVAAGNLKIASFSWGICDSRLPSAFRQAVEHQLALAELSGITVFVSSGDSGAFDCQRNNFADHALSVDFPSDAPQVVSVGGTLLSVGSDGRYLYEAGWEEPLSYAGGGGGLNTIDPAPPWQIANHVSSVHRALPDVSASASSSSGWLVRDNGNWDSFGGTSAATPFWAASMLLAEELAQTQGVKRTCFLAPLLYKLANTPQPYPPFHDITRGGNRHYDAGKGWDFATGLGSPDVYNLARDLVAYIKAHGCATA